MERGGSKLMQMQARFQQKQLQEREMKIASLYEAQQARALDRVRHSPSGSLSSITSPPHPAPPTAPHQPGKVRQMFEERRTKGIDKSYPLQPIQNTERARKPLPNSFSKVNGTKTQNGVNRTENRTQNGNKVASTRAVVEKKSGSVVNTQSVKKQEIRRKNVIEAVDHHYQQPELNATEKSLADDKALLSNMAALDSNDNMLEDETFPEALEPVTPREPDPPVSPPRRSRMTKTTASKPTPAPAPTAPPRKTPSRTVSDSKARGSMAQRPARATPVASIKSRSSPLSSPSKQLGASSGSPAGDGVPCAICGRRFAADRLSTHEAICRKAQTKKRKPFDALKHRLAGTEAEPFIGKLRKNPVTAAKASKPLNSNWRQKHEEFIQAIRAAKQVQQHLNAGGKLSDLPPPPPSENPDYVQCPHCGRRFNQAAAERHIPKCASYQFNKPKPGPAQSSKRR